MIVITSFEMSIFGGSSKRDEVYNYRGFVVVAIIEVLCTSMGTRVDSMEILTKVDLLVTRSLLCDDFCLKNSRVDRIGRFGSICEVQ